MASEKDEKPTLVESGIIYFFTRPRVNVDKPSGVKDLSRTFFVLRPIPRGVDLVHGLTQDSGKNRLFVLPKKVFPERPRDRYMAFVEKGQSSINSLKDTFLSGQEYETKTRGTQHQPPVIPVAEGVYSITRSGSSTYLTYVLTIPKKLVRKQLDLGLEEHGSFIISVKNPKKPGPANARLPKGPEYPKELQAEFGNYAWIPVQSKLLDYENAQILLVGHGGDVSHAENVLHEDQEDEAEDIDELAREDAERVKKLSGNETIFGDLHVSKKNYPSVTSTW